MHEIHSVPQEHLSAYGRAHLIGIGGCSMSGLAMILYSRGYRVTGSDVNESPFTERLRKMGMQVLIGHDAKNLGDCDVVIYSAAIKPDNPERVAAEERGIPQLERSEALGEISESYENVVGIAGCHGKTTITSMLSFISDEARLDATVHVGGFVDHLQGGVQLGKTDLFITEACEYVESFLTLKPTIALISNIDNDHLDYYGDMEHIVEAFRKFIKLLPENGIFIGCFDDPRVMALMSEYESAGHDRRITYGLTGGDYTADNIIYDTDGCPTFDVIYKGRSLITVQLHVPGMHSIADALAAIAVGAQIGAPYDEMATALTNFKNTRRRFEFYGIRDNVRYYHDYAHHPAEIKAVVSAARRATRGKLFCVFQCNSYTRAKTLFSHNVACFEGANAVLVADIYPGREKDDGSVHARDMVNGINESTNNAIYMGTFENMREYLTENAKPGDLVLTLGSGDVYKQTKKLL